MWALSRGYPDADIQIGMFLKLLKGTSERHGFYIGTEAIFVSAAD